MAGAADADPLAVVDPGRDLDLELLRLERAAVPRARRAGRLDDRADPHAGGTRLRADELAEDAARDLLQLALTAAGLTGDALGARLGAFAVAALAGGRDLDLDRALDAGERVRELDRDRDADVAAAAAPAAVAREEVVAEEGGEDVAQVREGEVARRVAAAPQPGVAVLVVAASPLGVGEHLVRLGDGAEALLRVRVRVHVRMELARELAEGLLDLGVGRRRSTPSSS